MKKKGPKFSLNLIPLEERIVFNASIAAAVTHAAPIISTSDITDAALTAPPLTHAAATEASSNSSESTPSWTPPNAIESLNTTKAQIIYVNASDTSSTQNGSLSHPYEYLQDALNYADGHPGTQYQIWVATGTYIPGETQASPNYTSSSTFLIPDNVVLIEGGFNGTFSANHSLPTDLNGENTVNTIVTVDGSTVELSGLTIENAMNASLSGDGGGLNESNNANVLLLNDTFTNDVVGGYGGGIYSVNSILNISNTTFSSDTANDGGGAIASQNDPNLFIQGSTFTNNSELYSPDGTNVIGGGAIFSLGDNLTLNSDTFGSINNHGLTSNGNDAGVDAAYGSFGGALMTDNDYVSINNSDFYGNASNNVNSSSSFGFGGAIASGFYSADLSLTITNSVFTGNQSDFGGAVFAGGNPFAATPVGDANVEISNSAFSNNFSTWEGGAGYFAADGAITINDSSFTDNNCAVVAGSNYGGGGALDLEGNTSITISNSQFDGNAVTGVDAVGGAIYSGAGLLDLGNGSLSLQDDNFTNNTALNAGSESAAVESYEDGFLSITGSVFNGNSANAYAGAFKATYDYSVSVTNSDFNGNSATGFEGQGGAIATFGDYAISFTGCVFSGNSTTGYEGEGGAIETSLDGSLSITGCVFTGNSSSGVGSAGGALDSYGDGSYSITGSIFNGNSANTLGGALYAYYDGTINIDNSQFINNSISSNQAVGFGGAVFTELESNLVSYVGDTFIGNTSNTQSGDYVGAGGAIASEGEYLSVTQSTFIDNSSSHLGGAISSIQDAVVTISNDQFIGNTVITNDTVNVPLPTAVEPSAITGGNTQNEGGAIYLAIASPAANIVFGTNFTSFSVTITNDTFIGNAVTSSNGDGGALVLSGDDNVTLSNDIFTSNSAQYGGALFIDNSTPVTISQSIFTSNGDSASGIQSYGGALYVAQSDVSLSGNTFENNTALRGGAIYIAYSNTIDIESSAFIGNQAALGGAIYMDLNNDTVTIGQKAHNTFQSNSVQNPDLTSSQAGKDIYVALASALNSNITAGSVNGQMTSSGIIAALTAQTKNVSVPSSPTILEVGGKGSYSNLQSALSNALYLGLAEILIAGGTYTPLQGICLPNGANPSAVSFNLPSDVELSGGWNPTFSTQNPSLYKTTLSGVIPKGNTYSVITALEGTVVVNSVSITGGNSDNINSPTAGSGGGIYAYTAYLIVGNDNIYGNSASAYGGGIFSFGQEDGTSVGATVIYDSTVNDNTALDGGGVYSSEQTTVNISNSTFDNNISTAPSVVVYEVFGGGATCFNLDSVVNIVDSTFSNNSTGSVGGAIYTSDDTITNIQGCTFTDNQAFIAGAIFSDGDSTDIVNNSIFTGNSASNESGALDIVDTNASGGGNGVTISNSTFNNNSSQTNIGAVSIGYAYPTANTYAVTLQNDSFVSNTTQGFAGALYINDNNASVSLTNCYFAYNSASEGGALYTLSDSTDYIANNTFYGNSASISGGAISLNYAITTELTGNDFVDNAAAQGGALYDNGTTTLNIDNNNFNLVSNDASEGGSIWLAGNEGSVNGISNADMGSHGSKWIKALTHDNQRLLEDEIYVN